MDFSFSEEQRMAAESVRQVLNDHCQPAALRNSLAGNGGQDEARWRALLDTGLAGMLLPESAGGLALTEVDFVLIAEACGYYALPEPLVEHAGIAAPLLAAAGAEPTLMERVATGEALLAIGHPINPLVADADRATHLLLHAQDEIHLLPASAVQLKRQESIDPFRRLFSVSWTPNTSSRIAEANTTPALWNATLDRGALFTAAQCLGLAQRAGDLAVAYAKERKQFGKPIGSYQAVKHLLANVQVKIEFARPVVYAAAAEIGNADAMSRARVSHAKLAAAEAADQAVRSALQVHGAMGYSWEVDLHFYLKRVLALTYAWGHPAFHRARVAARVFEQPLGPDHTFAREHSHA